MVSYHAFLEKICEPQACGVCLSVSNGQPPTVARDQRNQPSVMAISDSAKWFHFLNFFSLNFKFSKTQSDTIGNLDPKIARPKDSPVFGAR